MGWDRGREAGEPSYEIHWPAAAFVLDERSVLSFCLADGNEDPTPDDDEEEVDESEAAWKKKPRQPIDLSVELVDAEGHGARLPLSSFSLLQPQLETPYFKAKLLHEKALSEPIFQTFLFPLARFQAANPEFQPAAATKLRLVFDRTESGVVLFDKAAFGAAP
ncbi:MAG: hypothetical protein HYX69_12525 [Planctomycetia bacterium]|nr:hypothetical protein [Planctomycetia bacterium]